MIDFLGGSHTYKTIAINSIEDDENDQISVISLFTQQKKGTYHKRRNHSAMFLYQQDDAWALWRHSSNLESMSLFGFTAHDCQLHLVVPISLPYIPTSHIKMMGHKLHQVRLMQHLQWCHHRNCNNPVSICYGSSGSNKQLQVM